MARKMSPEEYQELGRRYYKLKQYEKAVEILTDGIEALPTLGLYDHRAAAYDKLDDFNSAVKDGRDMIKLDKKEVKGYLRTASVLEKMEKPDTALGIYKYGMKNVPVEDKNFKLLQQLHDKLTLKLSPATAVDPFTVLPVELAEMILEYLTFRQMVNCMRVSRGWKIYLAKLPKLWLHLDLSGARKPVPRSFVGQAVKRSESRLTRVTFHRFEHVDMLKNIAKMCKTLEEIEFITLPHAMSSTLVDVVKLALRLKKFVIRPEVTLDTAVQILRQRPTLEHISYGSILHSQYMAQWKEPLPSMKSFSMHSSAIRADMDAGVGNLLRQTPNLQSLTLSNMMMLTTPDHPQAWPEEPSLLPPLRSLVLKRIRFLGFPLLPPTVQRLHVEFNGLFRLYHPGSHWVRSRLENLTHLHLWNFDKLCADQLEDLLDVWLDDKNVVQSHTAATPLQSLSIRGVLREESSNKGLFAGPDSLFGRSPRILTPALQSLDIATMPCNDDEIEHLLTHDVGLRSIDLSHTNISGASIKMLADKLPSLQSIKADGCLRINGRDAINYAQRKGIAVSCTMAEQKGGRKVKYG